MIATVRHVRSEITESMKISITPRRDQDSENQVGGGRVVARG